MTESRDRLGRCSSGSKMPSTIFEMPNIPSPSATRNALRHRVLSRSVVCRETSEGLASVLQLECASFARPRGSSEPAWLSGIPVQDVQPFNRSTIEVRYPGNWDNRGEGSLCA